MICTSIQGRSLQEIYSILDGDEGVFVEMAEIRLDRCPLDDEDITELFSLADTPLVATCRISEVLSSLTEEQGEPSSEAEQKELLIKAYGIVEKRLALAVEAGAKYVDLEVEAPPQMSRRLVRKAGECGSIVIRSWHDFEGTPSKEEIEEMISKCFRIGGEVVKIVCTAASPEDCERVGSLYDVPGREGHLVAFCMGEEGRESRLDCLRKGAPFTYAALSEEEAAAPGQWAVADMSRAVYGDLRFLGRAENAEDESYGPDGYVEVPMPASKSFAQRAIIAASLAEGTSRLEGYTPCGDSEAAISVARAIGAKVSCNDKTLEIEGIGAKPGCLDTGSLNTGESGLLTRLMIPLAALLASGPVRIEGEKTLVNRPLKGAADLMAAFGVVLEGDPTRGREYKDVFVPLTVKGPLLSGKADISGKHGSQLISGLLMALPLAENNSNIFVSDPKSIPYMYITLDVMSRFGVKVSSEMEGDGDFVETHDWDLCTGLTFRVKGGKTYKAADFSIEGDWSAAANFLVAGAVFGQADVSGLDTASLQADLSIMDILTDAGACLSQDEDDGRTTGTVHVRKAPLSAFEIDMSNCPDLFPITAVLACFCEGTSALSGVSRLVSKESNRARAIEEMLRQMGVEVSVEGNIMYIKGESLARRQLCGHLLHGGSYTSSHDHRMVMALMVASLGADSPVGIDDTLCVAKSFPSFTEAFRSYAGRV